MRMMPKKANMKSIDEAASLITAIALDDSHGYAQNNRTGNPDYDCSYLIRDVLIKAGFDITFTWTGNMENDLLAHGFKKLTNVNLASSSQLKRGDILLYHNYASGNGHTAMYVGDGKIVHATSNEFGGVRNGKAGDQTGKEICVANYYNHPWSCVLRYESQDEESHKYYTVKPFDTLWSIARQFNTTIEELVRINNIPDKNKIYTGQVIKLTDDAPIKVETDKDVIKITIEGAKVKNCYMDNNLITIEVGD